MQPVPSGYQMLEYTPCLFRTKEKEMTENRKKYLRSIKIQPAESNSSRFS